MASELPPFHDAIEAVPQSLSTEDKNWGMLCHVSSLAGYLVGGLTFVGPLICWLMKKDSSKFVDDQGKESLNFQLVMLIYSLICIPLMCVVVGFFLLAAVHAFDIVCVIIAGIKASNGESFRYPFIFRLIK